MSLSKKRSFSRNHENFRRDGGGCSRRRRDGDQAGLPGATPVHTINRLIAIDDGPDFQRQNTIEKTTNRE